LQINLLSPLPSETENCFKRKNFINFLRRFGLNLEKGFLIGDNYSKHYMENIHE